MMHQTWESLIDLRKRVYTYSLDLVTINGRVEDILKWLKDNNIDFDWTGKFSTYEKDSNIETKLFFRFTTESDMMAFKLMWEE